MGQERSGVSVQGLIKEDYISAGKVVVQISLSYVCRYVFSKRISV